MYLPGVGPRRAEQLACVGIRSVGDLLFYFPFRHERQECRTIEHLDPGMSATVVGQVTALQVRRGRRGTTVAGTLTDNTGRCRLCWFNAGWMADKLERGSIIRATGKVVEYRRLPQLVNPRFEVLGENASPVDEREPAHYEGIYPSSAELSSRTIGRLISANIDRLLGLVGEIQPPGLRRLRELVNRRWAVEAMHRPRSEDALAKARRRLAYDELLLMQLAVFLSRRHVKTEPVAAPLRTTDEIDRRIRGRFGFPLTAAQDRVVRTIVEDLGRSHPMHRLLQGDVGSGKTAVALYAALLAVANRVQAAFLAPTELLAQQHHRTILRFLASSRVRHALLTGRMSAKARRELLQEIEAGRIDLVVGTHALFQDDVRFCKLGLVVVDEQHRFGVRQRALMRKKGPSPHYLVMTATPIPRTLTLTFFGDLDVSTIDELPPGRAAITTRVIAPADQAAAWDFVRSRLLAGEQAYVVYPLVDESDKLELRAATIEYGRLREQVFPEFALGLLHGQMASDERESVMADFSARRLAVLVATTVVEVGIDVPNATCMVIEHAERYGLSQLHQLRGRVGRGAMPGNCILMPTRSDGVDHERLAILTRTTDGFQIAEEDLRLRGPGEMLGTRQHGLPDFRVADLLKDGDLLRDARDDAARIIETDPQLRDPAHAGLRAELAARYRDMMAFMRAG